MRTNGVLLTAMTVATLLALPAPVEAAKTAAQCRYGYDVCDVNCAIKGPSCLAKCKSVRDRCLKKAFNVYSEPSTPSASPSSAPPAQLCNPPQFMRQNGTCGCESGLTGPNCDEIVIH